MNRNEKPLTLDELREMDGKPCEMCGTCENCKYSNNIEYMSRCSECLDCFEETGDKVYFNPSGFCKYCGKNLKEYFGNMI